jgi:adenosylhomocysteine nucleosidase
MPQEIGLLFQDIEAESVVDVAGRGYHIGTLYGSEVVVVCSGPGKVSAATATTTLIESFGVDAVVLAGLAGAASKDLRIGDIVVASELAQHDILEARPLFEQFALPLLPVTRIAADERMTEAAVRASKHFLESCLGREIGAETAGRFGVESPKAVKGLVATGDRFVAGEDESSRILRMLPDAKCVEMEGGAVAQVCQERGVPFAVFRAISDLADHSAEIDFAAFINMVARYYIRGVIRTMLSTLREKP